MSTLADRYEISDEEEARIQKGIAEDPDNPEWTEEDFRNAKPFAEVFPEWAAAMERDKQTVAASGGRKAIVSIILDVEVLEKLQAAGDDWQTRINDILKKAVA